MRREVAQWACEKLAGGRQAAVAADRDVLLELIAEVTGEAIAVDERRDSAAVVDAALRRPASGLAGTGAAAVRAGAAVWGGAGRRCGREAGRCGRAARAGRRNRFAGLPLLR